MDDEPERRCHFCDFVIQHYEPQELDDFGWSHSLCLVEFEASLAAEHAQDMQRERGL